MTVYVDDMRASFGRMKMCHMIADNENELHAMADKIGVARRWYQVQASHPHYDVCMSKRALAVKHGAVEIDRYKLVEIIRDQRATRYAKFPEFVCAKLGL